MRELRTFYFGDQGIVLDGPSNTAPEKFEAAKYSSGKVVMTFYSHLDVVLSNCYQESVSSFSIIDLYEGNNSYANCS